MNTTISLRALAEKYETPLGSVQKHSAKRKWSEKRKKFREKKADEVSKRVSDKDIDQTVKDLKRVVRSAGKLIDKVNKAIAQVDKSVYISRDEQDITTKEDKPAEDTEHVNIIKKRKMKTARMDTIIDTKRLSDLAKTLECLKEVLTDNTGRTEDTENIGVVEIAAATAIDERVEE